jgi:hypothetical protein
LLGKHADRNHASDPPKKKKRAGQFTRLCADFFILREGVTGLALWATIIISAILEHFSVRYLSVRQGIEGRTGLVRASTPRHERIMVWPKR